MKGEVSVALKPIKRTTGKRSSAFVGGSNTIGAPTKMIWGVGGERFNEKLPVNLVPANFLTRSLFNAPSKAICNLFANLFFGLF
jgi:hypothetical protein